MKRKHILTLLVGALLFITVGCATTLSDRMEVQSVLNRNQYTTVRYEDMTVGVRYLDRTELIRRFSTYSNPFLYEGSIPLYVVEVFIESNTQKKVMTNQVELVFPGKTAVPISQFRMLSYIRNYYVRNPHDGYRIHPYKGWSTGKLRQRVSYHVFPVTVNVKPQSAYVGFLVFTGRPSLKRKGELYIPVYDTEGGLFTIMEVNVDFK
jgi:hypothetical protein